MQAESKSLLAKLLATENITVQQKPGITTAMFDLRNRVLMMPLWSAEVSNDLQDLLLGHETGHALDTPTDDYKNAVETITQNVFGHENITDKKIMDRLEGTVRGFLNVIEDVRIDKRQKRRYPGLRKNYLNGYKELFDRDFFGTKGRDINSMSFIDRVNLYFKGGNVHLDLEFSPEERVFLKKIDNLETFPETVVLCEEVYRFCKDKLENENNMHQDLIAGEDDEGEDYDGDIDAYDFNGDETDGEEGQDSQDGSGSGDEQGSEGDGVTPGEGDIQSQSRDNKSAAGRYGAQGDGVAAPRSETDAAWEQKKQSLVRNENTNYIYVNFPKINWDKAVNDYKVVLEDWKRDIGSGTNGGWYRNMDRDTFAQRRSDLMKWRMEEKQAISFMVKEFEQRKAAELYNRQQVAKTGVIDTNKLHTYKFNDDIFRRITTIPKGKNHGFIMFLDWSGSMTYGLNSTIKQLLSLCMFCKQIQVPFEVYAFKDSGAENPFTHIGVSDSLKLERVVLRNFLSSRMKTDEFNFAASVLWGISKGDHISSDGMGGTPLNEAIIVAPEMVKQFRDRNKLEIVNTIFLTDGESNGMSCYVENPSQQRTGYNHYKSKYFYTCKETGKTYELPFGSWGSGNTATLLQILKDKTGSNLVGFFLFEGTFRSLVGRFGLMNGSADYAAKVKKFWADNKFYPVKNEGYDEYYVIDANNIKKTDNELDIGNTKTTKAMAKAFSKFAAKKTINRVLLRQFIGKVADNKTKVA